MNLENKYRETVSAARRVVIKIGTRVIARASGEPDLNQIKILADQVARLHESNHEILIVSSGAIGAGVEALGMTCRPTLVPDLQMCAAVGQAKLMALYDDFFKAHRIIIGQVLLTRADFRHKTQVANAKRTMQNMIEHRVVPIINENDVVANDEIKATFSLGDNDQLASRVAKLVHADLLVIFSTVDGVLDADKQRVPHIRQIEDAYKLINPAHGDSSLSKGGMESKLSAAKRALGAGCIVIIANGRQEHVLADIMAGKSAGTLRTKD